MPSLDLAMPIALFMVVIVALLLNKRVEGKLMATVEEKQFKTRDIVLLVVFIAIAISVIAFSSMYAPEALVSNIFLIVFLTSYTMLMYTFSYVFSGLTKKRAQLISIGFGIASLIVGLACLLAPLTDNYTIYRVIAFFVSAGFCFASVLLEQKQKIAEKKPRWYIAVQPPLLFVLLFVFFNIINNPGTAAVWSPFLMDVFGLTFAILIILYLSTLFSWKTVGLFAVMLTILDIILVFSGPMVAAAKTFTTLGLPVLVYLPNIPIIETAQGIAFRGLGLGDFFFAGVLAIQTYKKFGKNTAYISVAAMALAFGIWEAFLFELITVLSPIIGHQLGGFPGTLMIISGWVPIIAVKLFLDRNKPKPPATVAAETPPTPTETPKEPALPVQ
jgi:hypothetical protein